MIGLPPRAYNILFHTHTVTGIVICGVLFIIFFAGAISLYKQEFYQWEDPSARIPVVDYIDYERLVHRLDSIKLGAAAADELRVKLPSEPRPVYTIYVPIEDSTGTQYSTFVYNPVSDRITESTRGDGSTVGETLYRLHFLDQVPAYIGRYVAGIVSVFFAFAVITGLLIHWKNIASKFYAFSFRQAKKQFWTNAHTVFGVMGLPFQLMYAITGAFYMLAIFILAPAVTILFRGDQQRLVAMLYPTEAFHAHDHEAAPTHHLSISEGLRRIRSDYPGHDITFLEIINPGRVGAALGADLVDKRAYNGNGLVVLDLQTGGYKLKIKPGERTYAQAVIQGIANLHFGSFGGWLVKGVYFVLSVFTCFVIASGILLWKEARNKPAYSARQRRFQHRVTMGYLAACFSLFPATGLLFLSEQFVSSGTGHAHTVNTLFFAGWLLFAIAGCFTKTVKRVTRFNLLIGGVFACAVPVANGLVTGDWLWQSTYCHLYVFVTDVVWLLTGILAMTLAFRVQRRPNPGAYLADSQTSS